MHLQPQVRALWVLGRGLLATSIRRNVISHVLNIDRIGCGDRVHMHSRTIGYVLHSFVTRSQRRLLGATAGATTDRLSNTRPLAWSCCGRSPLIWGIKPSAIPNLVSPLTGLSARPLVRRVVLYGEDEHTGYMREWWLPPVCAYQIRFRRFSAAELRNQREIRGGPGDRNPSLGLIGQDAGHGCS